MKERQFHLKTGAALMLMLLILILGSLSFLVSSLNSSALLNTRNNKTTLALAQAKEALVGDTASTPAILSAGYLRLPDLGFGIGNEPAEGSSPPNFSGNNADLSVIGKVPWKTLAISPSRDGSGECLWYVVSGRFKNNPTSNSAFNWDTLGQLDIIDGNAKQIANNVAAIIIAPGTPLDLQSRTLSNPAYTQCGGNYEARNYLDPYNKFNASFEGLNYFSGGTNDRLAHTDKNKRFVLTQNSHYNDRFMLITVDDIFRPIIRRSDFSNQVTALMNDPYFLTAIPSNNNKGIGDNICNSQLPNNQTFCTNWKEMLLLATLPTPSSIVIDGASTGICRRVLIFGGQKTITQTRLTPTEKANPANYLENTNLAAFAIPIAHSSQFTGFSTFNANNPSAELLRCIP
jgi:hypothetical protein